MSTSNNSPNSVDAASADTFALIPYLVYKISVDAPIAWDNEGGLPSDNGGATGGRNKRVDELMFSVVSDSSCKIFIYVNKVIL